VSENTYIKRKSKLELVSDKINTNYSIFITAKAGQGKTVFVTQVAEEFFDEYLLYQISEHDKDPLYFCNNLYFLLKDQFGLNVPKFEGLALGNSLFLPDYLKYVDQIMSGLGNHIKKRIAIILDDIHLLPAEGLGYDCVCNTAKYGNANLSIILCSRTAFPEKYMKQNHIYIEDNFLKMDKSEFKTLANRQLNWLSDFSGLQKVEKMVDGWIMGASLVFSHMTNNALASIDSDEGINEIVRKYFYSLTTGQNECSEIVLLLSKLENFSKDMLIYAFGKKCETTIDKIISSNLFISKIDDSRYRFHHLYNDFLRESLSVLEKNPNSDFLQKVIEYELGAGEYYNAIVYLISSGDYKQLENVIRNSINIIHSSIHKQSIIEKLADIPENELQTLLWANLCIGEIKQELDPLNAEYNLISAHDLAQLTGDNSAKLRACSGLVVQYSLIYGNIDNVLQYHEKLKLLLTCSYKYSDTELFMGNAAKCMCHFYLNSGDLNTPFINNLTKNTQKSELNKYSLFAESALESYFATRSLVNELKDLYNSRYKLMKGILRNPFQKLMTLFFNSNFIAYLGEYKLANNLVTRAKNSEFFVYSTPVVNSFMDMFLTDVNITLGRSEKSLEIISNTRSAAVVFPNHLKMLIESYYAICLALNNDETSVDIILKALDYRLNSPSNLYFVVHNYLAAGTVFIALERYDEAIKYLETGLQTYDTKTITAGIHAALCYCFNKLNDEIRAYDHAIQGVNLLKKLGINSSWFALPDVYKCMYMYASKDIELKSYALSKAFEEYNIYFENYTMKPILEIKTFGDFSLSLNGKVIACTNINQNHKLILAKLICSENNECSIAEIIEAIWSDAESKKGRKSFDTALGRLRQFLKAKFSIDPNTYILVYDGKISLNNTKVDYVEFCKYSEKSQKALRSDDIVSSLISYDKAMSYFDGKFLFNIYSIDAVYQIQTDVLVTLAKTLRVGLGIEKHVTLLAGIIPAMEKWLPLVYDHDNLVMDYIKYLIDIEEQTLADKNVKNYKKYLESIYASPEEIEEWHNTLYL